MDLHTSLGRFIETSGSRHMPEAAQQLLELLDADEVEQLGGAGEALAAEEVADRLEARLQRLLRRADEPPDGTDLIEDAVAHLRANDGLMVAPYTFEDGEGIRWFVLADEDEDVVALYTTAPFLEVEV